MNRKLFGALAIAILALAVNVNAQTKAKANVPFSFDLGSKALPAGSYSIDEAGPHAIALHNLQTGKSAMITVQSAQRLSAQNPKLVFHKYGDTYFLYEVWSGSKIGMQIPESQREKEVKLATTAGAAPQEVVVALR